MSEKKSTIDDFTVLLKQTVEAKRLSGGKVQEIVQTGVKFLKDDLTLLTTLYKTHKSLPPKSSAKISSLYILDSLCRGVYKLKDKDKNKDGDGKTAGLARGFLSKVEGILEGWARDMSEGWSEGREKMIKILDIWTKSQTFSPAALARVQGIIDQTAPTGTSNTAATGTSTGVSSANNGMRSTTPPGSPPNVKTVGSLNGVVAMDGPAAGATRGTEKQQELPQGQGYAMTTITAEVLIKTDTPPIMPDFLSFLSTQIQSVGSASPATVNQVGSPSATVPTPTNLAFLNGILPPQNAAASPAQGSYSPSVIQNTPQNAAFPPLAANPIGNNFAENKPGQIASLPAPTLPIPMARPGQTDLGAAMAKRDEIAKKFAMMGQGPNMQSAPTITPSILPPSNMPPTLPTGDYSAAPPATQYHQGPSRGQPFPDRSGRNGGNDRYPMRNGGGWNSPPNPGGLNQNAASSSSAWRPNPHGRSRSRSPSRAMSRPEAVRQGRAPLPGAGQPGKDEFGRDVVSRRSASPQRDRPDYQRPRTDSAHDLGPKPVDHAIQTKSLIKLEDLDITTLNPAEAKTWEVLGEAWINTHGRPPEGPDVMMWFMNATAEKMSSAAGMNGNVMGNVITGAMPDMTGLTPTMNMMPMDNSHQQARLDWNDDGPYSGGGGGGGGGGQRGGGAGGRGRW